MKISLPKLHKISLLAAVAGVFCLSGHATAQDCYGNVYHGNHCDSYSVQYPVGYYQQPVHCESVCQRNFEAFVAKLITLANTIKHTNQACSTCPTSKHATCANGSCSVQGNAPTYTPQPRPKVATIDPKQANPYTSPGYLGQSQEFQGDSK